MEAGPRLEQAGRWEPESSVWGRWSVDSRRCPQTRTAHQEGTGLTTADVRRVRRGQQAGEGTRGEKAGAGSPGDGVFGSRAHPNSAPRG